MKRKSKAVGARKAADQLVIVREHYSRMYSIIQDYDILTPEIEHADCVCDLAEIEQALYEIEQAGDQHE